MSGLLPNTSSEYSFMRCALPLLVLFFYVGVSPGNDNWPQFRGPTGDGISDSKNVPTTWSETENIRWKTAIHDKGWSSPVIWGDQVWLTTAHTMGKSPKVSRA